MRLGDLAARAGESPRPLVELLDARATGLDEEGLRAAARSLSERVAAPYHSRSYRYPFALVAWHDQPVGVDLERIGPTDAALEEVICTPEERERTDRGTDRHRWLCSLWSAKEALVKVLGDAVAYDPARLASPANWPGGRAGTLRAEALEFDDAHVSWLCWRVGPTRPDMARRTDG